MYKSRLNIRGLKIGDLVTHVLYGPEWIGIIVSIKDSEEDSPTRQQALVQIQPGTKYDGFFEKNTAKSNRVNANLGYVSINWLFKIEKKNKKQT